MKFAKNRRPISIVTGVPGIGISMFFLYYIYRFINDKNVQCKSFALQFKDTLTYYLYHVPGTIASFDIYRGNPDDCSYNFPLLVDLKARLSAMFIRKINSDIHQSNGWWLSNYEKFGGIPQLIFDTNRDLSEVIRQAHCRRSRFISEQFFDFGFGCEEDDDTFIFIYMNPSQRIITETETTVNKEDKNDGDNNVHEHEYCNDSSGNSGSIITIDYIEAATSTEANTLWTIQQQQQQQQQHQHQHLLNRQLQLQ
eukprot:gene6449-13027_t